MGEGHGELETLTERTLAERLRDEFVGKPIGEPYVARDPVNLPRIRAWCDALGDRNPVYTDEERARESIHGGIVAPPTMLQAWTMKGLSTGGPPQAGALPPGFVPVLEEAGFTSVVATNCEQEYARYLRPGDRLTGTTIISAISDEKKTALGSGHFIESRITWTDETGETVGTQMFRIFYYKPAEKPAPTAPRPRPAVSDDTRFFWEGAARKELLVQRCASCGALRHPPRPMCARCRSLEWAAARMSGRGSVYSFVVHHHPPVPGFDVPFVVALIELDEGVRIVSNLTGVTPEEVSIGMPVEAEFVPVEEDLTLPLFAPRSAQ